MQRLSSSIESLDAAYDVVVVGSGYGGAISASRLARAGKRVAVLEHGREVLTGEFPKRLPDIVRELQVSGQRLRTGSPTGLYDVRIGEHMHVLVGCGLGGGSLVNAGVALRPDPRVFADPVWPSEVATDGLIDEGYRRAATWLAPATHGGAAGLSKFRALEASAAHLGAPAVAAPVVVSFDERTNAAGLRQPACTLCGDCCSGCNVGAKNTLALSYLPDAVAHGARLFTQVRVSHVSRREDRWRIVAEAGNGTREIEADLVVLGAGTLGSSEILLRSRERGLAVSDRLGHRFSGNGDIIAFGYGARERINAIGVGNPPRFAGAAVGATVTGQIEVRDAQRLEHEMMIQEGVLPSALGPALPAVFVAGGRLLGSLESLIKGVYEGPLAHLQTFFAVSHDTASGRLELVDDRLRVVWPTITEEAFVARLDRALETAVAGLGGRYVKHPLSATSVGTQPVTAHPLGGVAMGTDRTSGVVDHRGRVFDAGPGRGTRDVHPGLYVVDGSVIPRSLGVNPLLTISALAERAALLMAAEHGLAYDVAARPTDAAMQTLIPGGTA